MLKGIPSILSPELLKVLCEMGHSDRLVIADGNFPLDTYVEKPVNLMQQMPNDVGRVQAPIWDTYKEIVAKHDDRGAEAVGNMERFAFYDETKEVYCIIATGETAIYANIMLQKGVVIN